MKKKSPKDASASQVNPLAIVVVCCGLLVVAFILFLSLDSFDKKAIERFVKENINKSPEPFASLESSSIRVGGPAPDFNVIEIDGRAITKESFKGKPVIVWFTTSYCVPCQIAAKEIKRLDADMGGNAFNVLMVFIDPRESERDLLEWKVKYANEDWLVAFGNEQIVQEYQVRYLDSHRLLDQDGIVRYMENGGVTYDGYKERIQALLR